jgi:hypothetical protein
VQKWDLRVRRRGDARQSGCKVFGGVSLQEEEPDYFCLPIPSSRLKGPVKAKRPEITSDA